MSVRHVTITKDNTISGFFFEYKDEKPLLFIDSSSDGYPLQLFHEWGKSRSSTTYLTISRFQTMTEKPYVAKLLFAWWILFYNDDQGSMRKALKP